MIYVFIWFLIGVLAAVGTVLEVLYVEQEDITFDEIPSILFLVLGGPASVILIVVVSITEFLENNQGKVIFKAKTKEKLEDNT